MIIIEALMYGLWCAIVPELHDKFILTADAVRRLYESNAKLSRVITRSSTAVVNLKMQVMMIMLKTLCWMMVSLMTI